MEGCDDTSNEVKGSRSKDNVHRDINMRRLASYLSFLSLEARPPFRSRLLRGHAFGRGVQRTKKIEKKQDKKWRQTAISCFRRAD